MILNSSFLNDKYLNNRKLQLEIVMPKRYKMSKGRSRRTFKNGLKIKRSNIRPRLMRGGTRL